jgi:hypothetical protein
MRLVWFVLLAQVWTRFKIGELNIWKLFCRVWNLGCKINETSVACDIGPSVNPFQNRGNSTYENCFVGFEI